MNNTQLSIHDIDPSKIETRIVDHGYFATVHVMLTPNITIVLYADSGSEARDVVLALGNLTEHDTDTEGYRNHHNVPSKQDLDDSELVF